jgi:hypothetical protein
MEVSGAMAKKIKPQKKKNPQDATLHNIRRSRAAEDSLVRRLRELEDAIAEINHSISDLRSQIEWLEKRPSEGVGAP